MAPALEVLALTARLLAALVLLRAGLAKLRDAAGFEAALGGYRLLPERLVWPLSRILPPVELAVAASLALPVVAPAGAAAGMALFVAFAGAMAVNLLRGRRDIDCGCGGARQPLAWRLVLQNLALAAGLACAAFVTAPASPAGLAVAAAAAAGLFLAQLAAETLAAATSRKVAA